jgi:hypothetical protein
MMPQQLSPLGIDNLQQFGEFRVGQGVRARFKGCIRDGVIRSIIDDDGEVSLMVELSAPRQFALIFAYAAMPLSMVR